MRRPFVSTAAATFGIAIVAAFGACSEHLPAPLSTAEAGPVAPPWGLEVRPVTDTCKGIAKPTSLAKVSFERVSPITFDHPVNVVEHGGRLYVLQQGTNAAGGPKGAVVRVLGADPTQAPVVIDVSSRAVVGGEGGLLGLAFHPKFAQNHFVYLYYTAPHPQQPPPAGAVFQSVVARYTSPDDGITFDVASEKRILVVDQPFTNHNGGTLAFGNDGFLYFGLGDGGSGGDPMNVAQDTNQYLGKMLRLDVDGGDPYAIPPTNPFAGGGGLPEIYAYGFRNPFRFSFDRPTGDLWVGDVGQSTREEIDKVILGGNYGWKVREGKVCRDGAPACAAGSFIDPVVDHGRTEAIAITGGVVYRGTKVPELTGKYVYGDNGTGFFFAFGATEAAPVPLRLDLDLPRVHPAGFALDPAGEVVFADYTGPLWRIAPPVPPEEMPAKLSATGCVDPGSPSKPAIGLFAYDVNVAQWSDGAVGERAIAVPPATQIIAKEDGRLELPVGSVAMKTLRADDRPVETQLLVRRPDGAWSGYAYAWNVDGTDATLTTGATIVKTRTGRDHRIVDRGACMQCHNDEAGVTLGLEAAQLDRVFSYPDRPGNPLLTLDHLAMLTRSIPKESYAVLPALESYETVERRARAYLHANCTSCHRGGELANMDLRFGVSFLDMRVCDSPTKEVAPFTGKKRLVPGNPAASLLLTTMQATDGSRMPPAGSLVPHAAAITVLEEWIRSVSSCR